MRISDWSSDVCSSDLRDDAAPTIPHNPPDTTRGGERTHVSGSARRGALEPARNPRPAGRAPRRRPLRAYRRRRLPDLCRGRGRRRAHGGQIGRAACRERVCQYVSISVVAVPLKKKQNITLEISKDTT